MNRLGRGRTAGIALCAAALTLSGAPAAIGQEPAPPAPAAPPVVDLHRPGVRSYWAFVERRARVSAEPRTGARAVTRLKLQTEDGTHELVLVVARTTDAQGRPWLRVRLPIRGRTTGWVPQDALGELQPVSTWLRIDRRRFRATLVRNGRVVFRARVGVGQPQWPTPRGEFYIRDRLAGYGQAGSFYGPVAFGTSARSPTLTDWPGGGLVGIHGTTLPQLIPGRISHGCVRLRNSDILRLARLMPVGTPLTIS